MHSIVLEAFKTFAASMGMWVAIAIATVATLYFLVGKKRDIAIAEVSLRLVKKMLGEKLGAKGDAVFAVWIDGLDAIKDGNFTPEEMVEEFMKVVTVNFGATGETLSPAEKVVVHSAAVTTVQMFSIKSHSTEQAVKILSLP